jgi:hypothetical protein
MHYSEDVLHISGSAMEAIRSGKGTSKNLRLTVDVETPGFDVNEYYSWASRYWDEDEVDSTRAFNSFVADGHLPREFNFSLRVRCGPGEVVYERVTRIKVKPKDLDHYVTFHKTFRPTIPVRKTLFAALGNEEVTYEIQDDTKYGYCEPSVFRLRVTFDEPTP